ncbi:MAG: hypothetical protein JST11_21980 [Acidobacteria bacterium]|nr:hypothetical protein [Acidobacteriota bacterium]
MGTAPALSAHRLDTVLSQPLSQIVANRDTFELLRFDIRVTAQPSQPSGYQRIQYTIASAPGVFEMFTPQTTKKVNVLILDEFGNRTTRQYLLSSKGQTIADTVEVPLADPSKLHGSTDRGRTIYVLADPLNELSERTEANNFVAAYCYTIG